MLVAAHERRDPATQRILPLGTKRRQPPAQVARGGQLLEDAAVLLDDELRGGEDVLAHAPPEADVLKEEEGLAVELLSREELFITSKLFPQSYPYVQCGKDIDATLKRLGADYLDLLLFHQPYGEYVSGWKVMEEAVAAGTLRAIGLSDFCPERLVDVAAFAEVTPAANQIESPLPSAGRRAQSTTRAGPPLAVNRGGDRRLIHAGRSRSQMGDEPPVSRTPAIDDPCTEITERVGARGPTLPLSSSPRLHRELRIRAIRSSLMIEASARVGRRKITDLSEEPPTGE